MKGLQIEYHNLQDIKPYQRNPRVNKSAVDKVVTSIKEFGFNVPILMDEDHVILAGHTRYLAAQELGLTEVPCIILSDLTERKAAQYRIVDNKVAELSSWDYDKLITEMDSITEFDMSVFEFGMFDQEEDDDVEPMSNLNEGIELDLDDFGDEAFDNECPYCGFKWNE